jgi:predicted HicB family RNase H-like nuclease
MNLMTVDGYHAKIDYDEETDQFRGEILGLSGGADFYGSSPEELRREFKKSLDVFLEVCKEQGIEPRRHYSGKFNLRIPPELHEKLAMTAEAQARVSIHLLRKLSREVSPRRGADNIKIQTRGAKAGFYAEIPSRF